MFKNRVKKMAPSIRACVFRLLIINAYYRLNYFILLKY